MVLLTQGEFNGAIDQDIEEWLESIEHMCRDRGLDKADWSVVLKTGLSPNVLEVVDSVEKHLEAERGQPWTWTFDTLKTALIGIDSEVRANYANRSWKERVDSYRRRNPTTCKVAKYTLYAGAAAVMTPPVVVLGLHAAGFGATGIAAGSVASWIQAKVYGGAIIKGSVFALAQAAGAGGIAVAAPAAQVAGVAAGAAGGWLSFSKPKSVPSDAWQAVDRYHPSPQLLAAILQERMKSEPLAEL